MAELEEGGSALITRFDLLVIFILLQVADILTTNAALGRPGVREGRWRWPLAVVCLLYVGIVANNLMVAHF